MSDLKFNSCGTGIESSFWFHKQLAVPHLVPPQIIAMKRESGEVRQANHLIYNFPVLQTPPKYFKTHYIMIYIMVIYSNKYTYKLYKIKLPNSGSNKLRICIVGVDCLISHHTIACSTTGSLGFLISTYIIYIYNKYQTLRNLCSNL